MLLKNALPPICVPRGAQFNRSIGDRVRIWSNIVASGLAVVVHAQETPQTEPPPATLSPPPATAESPDQEHPSAIAPSIALPLERLGSDLGYSGAERLRVGDLRIFPVSAMPDRWRIGWPEWDRYGRSVPNDAMFMNATGGDSPYTRGHPANPYDRNLLKGDYPVAGSDLFLNVTATSDTLINARELPTPSGVSAANSGSFDFFRDGRQTFIQSNLSVGIDLFKGSTAFRPVDWLLRITPVVNVNAVNLREFNGVNIDVRKGDERTDEFATLQEAFLEYHLGDTSHWFDIAAAKIGRQLFVSDFRGFIFNDVSDGLRLFGNAEANRFHYNLALFNQPEKDTNSELNEMNWRQQQVFVANCYFQDFLTPGYTIQTSFHWNHDTSDERYDENGFLVRPDLAGDVALRDLDAFYLGVAGDGHVGRLNINHALYYAFGEDDHNPIAGRQTDISAFLGAIEFSIDVDWLRPKVSVLYASGDSDPTDGTAGGFDGIVDNPAFAGGSSSFYQSQGLRLFGVNLTSPRSFYNDLSSSKGEGQANFVNPGTILFNAGLDAEITPKLRASLNVNSLFFAETDSLEYFLNQPGIDNHIGEEINLLTQYRPLLNNNIIFTAGGSVFFAGDGFTDIYENNDNLWQLFGAITLTY